MSLADELMNDLDGLSDDGGPSDSEQPTAGPSSATGGEAIASTSKIDDEEDTDMKAGQEEEEDNLEGGQSAVGYVPAGGTRPAEELDRDEVEHMNLKTIENVESVVKLHKSKRLQEALTVSSLIFKRRSWNLILTSPLRKSNSTHTPTSLSTTPLKVAQ
jgi:U4/U6 small nuclear ribonucleoprotein PRP31